MKRLSQRIFFILAISSLAIGAFLPFFSENYAKACYFLVLGYIDLQIAYGLKQRNDEEDKKGSDSQ